MSSFSFVLQSTLERQQQIFALSKINRLKCIGGSKCNAITDTIVRQEKCLSVEQCLTHSEQENLVLFEDYNICSLCDISEQFDLEHMKCNPKCDKLTEVSVEGECKCKDGLVRLQQNPLKCQQCPQGTIYTAQTQSCEDICPNLLEIYNKSTQSCDCIQPLYRIDGICSQCPDNNNYYYNTAQQKCQYIQNQTNNDDDSSCWDIQNAVQINGKCQCQTPYQNVSGICQICPQSTFYDPFTQQCIEICQGKQTFFNGECVCKTGYLRIGLQCSTCPLNTLYNPLFLTCDLIPTPEPIDQCTQNNEYYNLIFEECLCKDGFVRIQGQCSQCPFNTTYDFATATCEQNTQNSVQCSQQKHEILFNGICICDVGYYRIQQSCGQCNPGQFYNFETFQCQNRCSEIFNEIYNPLTDECQCDQLSGYFYIDGRCSQCDASKGLAYNQLSENCQSICQESVELYDSVLGDCVLRCPIGSVYSVDFQQCFSICAQDKSFNLLTEECDQKCSRENGVVYDFVMQQCVLICREEDGVVYNQLTDACESICALGQFYNVQSRLCENQCNTTAGEIYNSITSQCQALCNRSQGLIFDTITQKCQSICGTNNQEVFFYNTTTQQCQFRCPNPQQQKYNPQSQTCQNICPDGLLYNITLQQCEFICSQGEIFNQQTQSCDQICPLNRVYINGFCECQSNLYQIVRDDSDEEGNTIVVECGTCNIEEQNYNPTTRKCQLKCPDPNSYFSHNNGTTDICQCNPPFIVRNNIECVSCPQGTQYSSQSGSCVETLNDSNNTIPTCDPITEIVQFNVSTNSYYCGCNTAMGYFFIFDRCNTCPFFTIYNAETFSCQLDINQIVVTSDQQRVQGEETNNDNEMTAEEHQMQMQRMFCIASRMLWIEESGQCKCQEGYIILQISSTTASTSLNCAKCPKNSSPDSQQLTCLCNEGYIRSFDQCIRPLLVNTTLENGNDSFTEKCADRSNQLWNGSACICQTGFFMFPDGECYQCMGNSYFNGLECKCRRGYYMTDNHNNAQQQRLLLFTEGQPQVINSQSNNITVNNHHQTSSDLRVGFQSSFSCTQCHITCATCFGPEFNQCLSCSNISQQVSQEGKCHSQNKECPLGYYSDNIQGQDFNKNETCQKCSSYCQKCQGPGVCTECVLGFQLKNYTISELFTLTICQEICGDGKRFELDCDDGNVQTGDGCSDVCQSELNWTCMGGTTQRPDRCIFNYQWLQYDGGQASDHNPNDDVKSLIQPGQVVVQNNKVYQNFRISYLPLQIVKSTCEQCTSVFNVQIIQGLVLPDKITVKYVEKSKYQFVIEFLFEDIWAIPPFKFNISISTEYSEYFTMGDMSQQVSLEIQPMLLSRRGERVNLY